MGLELADSSDAEDVLEVDVLIGSDVYWRLVTGRMRRGRTGPTVIQTKSGGSYLDQLTDRRLQSTSPSFPLTLSGLIRVLLIRT